MAKYKTTRLAIIRRMIAIPILLQERESSQTELKLLFEIDGITIRWDILALGDCWPI